jgi:hypothetical protein
MSPDDEARDAIRRDDGADGRDGDGADGGNGRGGGVGGRRAGASAGRSGTAAVVPPPEVLRELRAKVLDPVTATRLSPDEEILPTVYVVDELIVSNPRLFETGSPLLRTNANGERIYAYDVDPGDEAILAAAARNELPGSPALSVVKVRLRPTADQPTIDAWDVLQDLRRRAADDDLALGADLNHVYYSGGVAWSGGGVAWSGGGVAWSGGGVAWSGGGTTGSAARSEYGTPGFGARTPVAWLGPDLPAHAPNYEGRRPVIAILDTDVGRHRWLPEDIVLRYQDVDGVPLGRTAPDPREPTLLDPFEGLLDPDAGHGTFIAGLVRQACPEAIVLAGAVMASSGFAAEDVVLRAVKVLILQQLLAVAQPDVYRLLDVLSLSLGYYDERPARIPRSLLPIVELGALGVAVVAAAGNDATDQPFFPAALSIYADQIADPNRPRVHVASVGALNPNGAVALFSNAGDWVTHYRRGACVVSTLPEDFNGSLQPAERVDRPDVGPRESLDIDDFTFGFASWSGTSFAAPYLAGELAAEAASGRHGSMADRAGEAAVARGAGALDALPRRP